MDIYVLGVDPVQSYYLHKYPVINNTTLPNTIKKITQLLRICIHDKKDGVMTTLGFQWNRKTLWSYRMRCRRPLDPGSGDITVCSLQWRHNGRDDVSYHQPHQCLLNRVFRRRSKKTSKLRVTGLCAGNSPVTGEFPAQRASNAENVSTWWRHHVIFKWHHSYSILICWGCMLQTIMCRIYILWDLGVGVGCVCVVVGFRWVLL